MYIGLLRLMDLAFHLVARAFAAFRSLSEVEHALSVKHDLHPQIGNPEGKLTHSLNPEESGRVAELAAHIYETHQTSPI